MIFVTAATNVAAAFALAMHSQGNNNDKDRQNHHTVRIVPMEKKIFITLDLIVAEPTPSQVHGFGEAFTEHVAPMGRPPSSDSVFCEGMPRSDGFSEHRLIFIRVLMPLWLVALI